MLKKLRLRDVGPAPSFDIEFSDRLNIFTGDNGLGKSFILDIAWWALTGTWAGPPAWPRRGDGVRPQIEFHLIDKNRPSEEPSRSEFDFRFQLWRLKKPAPVISGLVVYARIDGGFSLWDPARNYRMFPSSGTPAIFQRARGRFNSSTRRSGTALRMGTRSSVTD